MHQKLKLFTLDWDLNPHDLDSNPAKTHSTWFQDLVKPRFLMSHCSKNSVRNKVIGKKWIHLEKNTLHRQEYGLTQRAGLAASVSGVVNFYGLGNFTG